MSSGTLRPLRLVRSLRLLRRISDAPESLVAAAAVLAVAETVARGGSRHVSLPVALLLCLCTTLPLGLQRTYPAAAAVAASAATLLSLVPFQSLTVSGLAVQLAVLYRLGRAGSRRLTVLLVLPFVALALSGPPHAGTGVRVLSVLLASLASAAAGAGLAHRARSEALEHTAAQRVIADTLLAHAARGERARIARELHDVVAHHISMIAVQAETARLTTPGLPTAGAQRLLSIGDTARAALTEMRRLLGVLREDAGTQGPDRRPQPGLPQLIELLDEARDATGTGTRLIVHGPVTALDPGVELTAYRIVQEALTNARRHAPGAAVDVELRYCDEALRLRIRDNGPGPGPGPSGQGPGPGPGHGHGLLGMRERAATVGGDLRTGLATGGGFLIEARLPIRTKAMSR
ncbi:histidine kinase [Streptomyces sp. NBC_01537]|uniref:sensor histidine kinase n=1 Tax=Streptomyces sp. NBC_01537 TaxID=2903896 RepID=UPI00386E4DE7